jgi:hypothetical protein
MHLSHQLCLNALDATMQVPAHLLGLDHVRPSQGSDGLVASLLLPSPWPAIAWSMLLSSACPPLPAGSTTPAA